VPVTDIVVKTQHLRQVQCIRKYNIMTRSLHLWVYIWHFWYFMRPPI